MDIENKQLLQNYLSDAQGVTVHTCDKYEVLKGGVSNKAILYSGAAGNWVIKQALTKLRVDADWFSSPERLHVEAKAIAWLNTFLPKNAVPGLVFFDLDNYILGMEAVPQPHYNFKSLLLKSKLDLTLVAEMARLLATIHNQGVNDSSAESIFSNRTFFKTLRIEAYYEYTASQLTKTAEFYHRLIEESLKIQCTAVHGDYSPKNILVRNGSLILLDHEVMHWGDPAFDVGFSICHLLSKSNHLDNVKFVNAAILYWDEYSKNYIFGDAEFENRATRHLMGCLLARVKGRSPLEYLSEEKGANQVQIVLDLIDDKIFSMVRFIIAFRDRIINK